MDESAPQESDRHLLADDHDTLGTARVKAWLTRRCHFHVHFTLTGASWLKLVERLFTEVTERCVGRRSCPAVVELEQALLPYLEEPKQRSQAFCVASADRRAAYSSRRSPRVTEWVNHPERDPRQRVARNAH
ncbi:MAG: hypothetical protein ACP5U2_15560 [Bryobacteraceae bacterium]